MLAVTPLGTVLLIGSTNGLDGRCNDRSLLSGVLDASEDSYPLSPLVSSVFTDVDSDGIEDLVLLISNGSVLLYRAVSQGFQSVQHVSNVSVNCSTVLVVDANADGWNDIFVVCPGLTPPLALYLNSGSGVLTQAPEQWMPSTDALASDVVAVVTSDYNNDGFPDLLLTTSSSVHA
jgi:hypothetical protein